jgi:hypothetical protein
MNAIIIDESFTATSEQQMRDFALAYQVYMRALEIAGDDADVIAMVHRAAHKAMGGHFETSRKCWELMYG